MKFKLVFILILITALFKAQVPSTPFIIRRPELKVTSMTLSVSGSQLNYDFRIADGGSTPVECGFIYSYNTKYPNGDNDPNDQVFNITTPDNHNGVITGNIPSSSFLVAAYYFIPFVKNRHSTIYGTRVVLAPNWPTVTINSKVWLAANLGASRVATSYNDSNSYGFKYQWGRGSDGHQVPTSAILGTGNYSNTENPGHGSFILSNLQAGEWMVPQNNGMWAGIGAINNPCPSGWRIPIRDEWISVINNISGGLNRFSAFSSDLKLPSSEARMRTSGAINATEHHQYWLNYDTTGGVRVIFFHGSSGSNWGEGGDTAAYGGAVRCVQN